MPSHSASGSTNATYSALGSACLATEGRPERAASQFARGATNRRMPGTRSRGPRLGDSRGGAAFDRGGV